MKFISPDPQNIRISDCGRYMIVKRPGKDGAPSFYELWFYQAMSYGHTSAESAALEAETNELERYK